MDYAQKVKALIGRHFGIEPEQVHPHRPLIELGDSLAIVELIMLVEEEFRLVIEDDEAEKLTTVQKVIDYVAQRKGSAP